ncbi:MAG: glycine C-acetyltransferase/8-amino-7-oxononanoate synthase [Verrucomicrobia bacterium]|nr:MAG: glycine C-acetyltransferase/8-amino-7-oxononanoate synthase [Verrucomicrobiota bacterium]
MQELREITSWIASQETAFHRIPQVSSLPDPVFECEGKQMVSFSSNNYLALAHDPRMIAAAREGLERYGVANCESRLLGGDMEIYVNLERKLAALKGKESAMLYATGYLTNLGVLSALPRSGMLPRVYGFRPTKRHKYAYFSDESNHTSIREGIALSGIPKLTYAHCDMEDLRKKLKSSEATTKIIVSDGVFSMDGDIAPLPDLLKIADEFDATLYVDDAHGTGVIGSTGGGIGEHFGVNSPRLISMGTLSKAYGAIGGFIATENYISDTLRFTSSAYGFTSTMPPDQVYAVSTALDIVKNEPERRERLWDNQRYFVQKVEALEMPLVSKETCIVPVLIGDEEKCERSAYDLSERGFHVDSIIYPAVKRGKARLRFNMNAHHTHSQIDELVDALGDYR